MNGNADNERRDQHAISSPTPGERIKVRGPLPEPFKHRTRTAAARDFARQLRKNSTDAEKRLWRLLRDRRFSEFKFRRQYPCGIYFLDFFCTKAKLAVELDGGGHGFPDQRARDQTRNRFLARKSHTGARLKLECQRSEISGLRQNRVVLNET